MKLFKKNVLKIVMCVIIDITIFIWRDSNEKYGESIF